MNKIRIKYLASTETVKYAAEELERCLEAALPVECMIEAFGDAGRNDSAGAVVLARQSVPADSQPAYDGTILLEASTDDATECVDGDLWRSTELPKADTLNDTILIDIQGGTRVSDRRTIDGFICGSNERSTLIGVYRFLYELGFRWIRPGADGEIVPDLDRIPSRRFYVRESEEHVRDVIEWIPRVGMNGYFIQFREAYTFFDRWYRHLENPLKEGSEITIDDARHIVSNLSEEIAKRGLLYHAVGHGWTCEPFGIPGIEWERYTGTIPAETKRFFAEIDGRRELFDGIPLNTNLCYSNPEVRARIVDSIAQYAADHREVSYLHFWLADGTNNHCECDECKKRRPSDYYLMMLNELDEKLQARDVDTRIVFLIYVDLLWPPEHEQLENPERFVLMFAPITRSYSKPFTEDDTRKDSDLKPFVRNNLEFPRSVGENLAYLRQWKKQFGGDSFDFDYHLMWDHYLDPGYMRIAEVLHADLRNLQTLGMNGYMSCQIQRAAMPTGLCLYILGSMLWNREQSFADICNEYFEAAFGDKSHVFMQRLDALSNQFAPDVLRGDREEAPGTRTKRYTNAVEMIDGFLPLVQASGNGSAEGKKASFVYLERHLELSRILAQALAARAADDENETDRLWKKLRSAAWETESRFPEVFDAYFYTKVFGPKLFNENE